MKKSILLLVIIFILLGVIFVLFTLMLKNQQPSSIQLQQSLSDSSEIAKLDDEKEVLAENLEETEATESTIWQIFRDEQFGYTIEYPQGWYIAQSDNITIKGFWPERYEGEALGVWVDVKDNSSGLTALQWWEQEISELANAVELKNNTTIEEITLNSIQGVEVKTVKGYYGKPFKKIYLPHEFKIYLITTSSLNNEIFDNIISSFEIIEAEDKILINTWKSFNNIKNGFSFKHPSYTDITMNSADLEVADWFHVKEPRRFSVFNVIIDDKTLYRTKDTAMVRNDKGELVKSDILSLEEYVRRVWEFNKFSDNQNFENNISDISAINVSNKSALQFTLEGGYETDTGGYILNSESKYIFVEHKDFIISFYYPTNNLVSKKILETLEFKN